MEPVLARLVVVAAIVAVVAGLGVWWRWRDGRLRSGERAGAAGDGRFAAGELTSVGLADGTAVRGLLLSSPTCAPCHSVRQVLTEVAAERPAFAWVSVDAADHLPLTRRHHVLRVPTLFVVDRDGRILARTSGVPAVRDLVHLVDRHAGGVGGLADAS